MASRPLPTYERATDQLDALTDGRELSKTEEEILVELEDEILAYQRNCEQFRESHAAFEATCTPVQLIKDLMETLGLTGSDLPEICLLYTSPSPRDRQKSRMPSSA